MCNANQDLSAFVSKDVVETTSIMIHLFLIQDYMEDSHGKEINLMQTTVKIPGQHKPRLNTQLSNGSANDQSGNFRNTLGHLHNLHVNLWIIFRL